MVKEVTLRVKVGRLYLKNPTMNASGILDTTPGLWKRLHLSGSAAIVTKSTGMFEREPYCGPNVVEIECGLLNAMGLPNPGIDVLSTEIAQFKKDHPEAIIIASIFGSSAEEFQRLAYKVEEAGADAVELNLSCPHAKGYGMELGTDPKMVKDIVETVKTSVKIPVFPKLTPNVTSIVDIAGAALSAGADAIVAINSVKALRINVDIMRPVLGNIYGGYSGEGILPIGIRAVWDIYREFECDIIGVGGISNYKHALEYILAGAKAVQIGSAIHKRGFSIFNEINEEISRWLQERGFKSISDIVALAQKV
ncbi:MAG TPA: dihydroorotate dehydrogenase [Euryarchaeota archaeon]|nr:dihydroorotate dehydrogenase [Euryarchaeota archaeon]